MAHNDFTKNNFRTGIQGQALLDDGLNVFALELFLESFTARQGKDTKPLDITYKGVVIKLQISKEAI